MAAEAAAAAACCSTEGRQQQQQQPRALVTPPLPLALAARLMLLLLARTSVCLQPAVSHQIPGARTGKQRQQQQQAGHPQVSLLSRQHQPQ